MLQVRFHSAEPGGGGEAIAGAAIVADSQALGPSLNFSDVVDEFMGRRVAFSYRAITDAGGVATLEAIPGRALRIGILAPGQPPAFRLINESDFNTGWLDADNAPLLQFRIGLPGSFSEQWSAP